MLAPQPADDANRSSSSPDVIRASAPVTPNHLFLIVLGVIFLLLVFGVVGQCIARRQGERFLDMLQRLRLGGEPSASWPAVHLCCGLQNSEVAGWPGTCAAKPMPSVGSVRLRYSCVNGLTVVPPEALPVPCRLEAPECQRRASCASNPACCPWSCTEPHSRSRV